ncbi:SGNH/GDSL hydrolase family protein [Pseudanabaena sp. FACHB-2040]|uniref:SGNH/GDSL hydrolase family protein n=1 Tax=Pseudanabaena sp. FACHB-2040 TaxID=2692859 RepID=UPI0016838AE5|nr:SGNH/GDSL hydrolase family protein [Pseudanabaena sp. FACHB-2040]MBD2255968.1 SGNH/GDSL hydrolase family protein [Pseudanabaena sp. FACHB-2040]
MRVGLLILVAGLVLVGLAEVFLRWRYGLGSPPLYVADTRMGYRLAPGQRIRRFGNRIEVNAFSMRGGAIHPQRPDNTLRVLMLGDSIINGGWWTDQADLISQLVQTQLRQVLGGQFAQVEVLNASANSWGPRHELGYVARFGLFESQVVLVVLNTDDLFAIAPTSIQVGRDRSYPRRRPPLALVEALTRLQKPRPLPELEILQQQGGDRVGSNLEALRQINLRAAESHSRLLLAMTPLRRELEEGPRDYEVIARQRLLTFTQAEQVPYLDFLPLFQQSSSFADLYRDHIHLSTQGNQLVSQHLTHLLETILAASGALASASFEELAGDDSDLWQ